jgi:hypothetical protein
MEGSSAPPEIITLAEDRASARAAREWSSADELKARIEAAGWRVVDDGTAFTLHPTRPPDVVEEGQTLYGAVESVPSRLAEPNSAEVTVVIIATGDTASPNASLDALQAHCAAGTEVLAVVDGSVAVTAPTAEVIRTVEPFSPGDALQAALQRATGAVIVVLEPECLPVGDILSPLAEALGDPSVGIAAIDGLLSVDLHRYGPAALGDVTTVRSGCYAFRRADAITRGPIDGRLGLRGSVAAWWGLLLRDEGAETPPRRALVIELPLQRPGEEAALPDDHARRARRDGYRIADRFRGHDWLASDVPPQGRLVGDGAHEHDHDDDTDEAGDTGQS